MYLTPAKAQALSRVMQTLAEPHAEHEIRRRVGELMLDLLDADYYASYVWQGARGVFGGRVALNMDDRNLQAYETYYQHRDPITPVMQRQREPTLVVQVMPQHELVRTEFFNDFLFRDGLYWGVNLYAWDGDRNIGDMRVWRSRRRENFDQATLDLLGLIRPAFVAALRRARGTASAANAEGAAPRGAEPSPPRGAPLSEREQAVVELAALGWPDKAIARRLGIGFPTVRTHLGNAFRKLGVENRVQLAGAVLRGRG
jgi:DNA-binding CsgD family transcriptional regulator